ncbi:MAG TPA: phosphopantetheine-binding protein [Tepidisphaeraceae bacterium]|jgi:3-hydroxyacyl-[acyl-carrier-protein] dehydratase
MPSAVDPVLVDQIKTLLRRDLKLGIDADLRDDTPLVGGDFDLDSLDILLLVSSIEKQFGIKIPSEAVGKWVFQDLGTLAKYVADNRETLKATNVPAAATPAVDWLGRLPHGPAFRFVSRVDEVTPGKSARGVWNLNGSEAFFAAHFPGRPLVPGVLLIEALAQLSGFTTERATASAGKLAHADVRFESAVTPPAVVELTATVVRELGPLLQCDVVATVDGTVAARGTVTLALE